MDVPGAGYWIPSKFEYQGWLKDGSIIFAPCGGGIVFLQYDNINDAELNEIAVAVDGE